MAKVDVCHSTGADTWVLINIDTNALGGHSGHSSDIWPPIPGITSGKNWDQLPIWANDCVALSEPTPTLTSEPTSTPTSEPTPAPTAEPTTTPTLTPTPSPVPTASSTSTPTPESLPTPGSTPPAAAPPAQEALALTGGPELSLVLAISLALIGAVLRRIA